MKNLSILILVVIVSMFSCKKTSTTKEENKEQNSTIAINTCNLFSTNINSNFSICYDSLVTDSRCPSDVVCVWAGIAIVKLSFTQNNSIVSFKLSSMGGNYFPPKDTTINGIKIKLIDLIPYPKFSGSNNETRKVVLEIR